MSWIGVSGVLGFLGVVLGAFGAHGLEGKLSAKMMAVWHTAVLYHLIHAVALLALALYARATSTNVTLPAGFFAVGILLFSGSLYALALTDISRLGIVTPFGGLCFLAGWALVLIRLR